MTPKAKCPKCGQSDFLPIFDDYAQTLKCATCGANVPMREAFSMSDATYEAHPYAKRIDDDTVIEVVGSFNRPMLPPLVVFRVIQGSTIRMYGIPVGSGYKLAEAPRMTEEWLTELRTLQAQFRPVTMRGWLP